MLVGDPLRLGQVLINYGNNAVKFTHQGGIRIAVTLAGQDAQSVLLRVAVSDTGVGIAEAHLGQLFQSFRQADSSISRHYGGTGLGLAIARRLAEMMGGEVGVTSRLGQGSTFWFTARLARSTVAAPAARALTGPDFGMAQLHQGVAEGGLRGARVLVVDDNEINLQIAREMLAGAGLAVELAADGEQAVQRVREQAFDLVLMDMQMPVMDGLEATRTIRRLPGLGRLPIAAMTANAMDTDRRQCTEAGMNDFLTKPIEPERLFELLRRWIAPREAAGPSGATPAAFTPPPGQGAARAAAPGDREPVDTPDPAAVRSLGTRLLALLADGDPAAQDLAQAEPALLRTILGPDQQGAFAASVRSFDFDQAAELLRKALARQGGAEPAGKTPGL
jgi:CheY-like chemotaxis protein